MVSFDEFKQFFNKFPDKPNIFYYTQFPKGNKNTIRNYKFRLRKQNNIMATGDATPKKRIIKKSPAQKSANSDTSSFIDDPNELLMSCAKRALNKQDPDVRWGTILVNILKETKQLEAVSNDRDEIQSKLKQYSTEDLTRLRKKLTRNLQIDG